MLGESVLRHPNKLEIDEMFNNGKTAKEVSDWLRMVQKDNRLRISVVSLQYYRKNFLKLSRMEINQRRSEMQTLGKTRDVTALSTFAAAKDFIDAKSEQTKVVEQAISEFKEMKTEITTAIKLLKEQTVDAEGKPVFVPRNYEILEKLIGRLESTNNTFIKNYKEFTEQDKSNSTSNTTININQMEQEVDVVKNAVKRILLEIDPLKLPRFLEILKEEAFKSSEKTGIPSIQISIDSQGNQNTNINIVTKLPTPEEAEQTLKEISNENTTEYIVDVEPEQEPPKQEPEPPQSN